MSDRPHDLPEVPQDDDLDETRMSDAASTRGLPSADPTPPGRTRLQPAQLRRRRPPSRQETPQAVPVSPRRGRARARRDSGMYLPLWSLALMLFVVIAIAAGLVLLVLSLGGNTAPEKEPVIIISSPVPTERPAEFPVSPATPTIPPEYNPNPDDAGILPPPLVLSGPTLEPVELSPTPFPIQVGGRVAVIDVGTDELNVRDSPGVVDTNVIFRADEGSVFAIMDGPRQADGLTWWQISDPQDPSRTGWAAANYLQRVE